MSIPIVPITLRSQAHFTDSLSLPLVPICPCGCNGNPSNSGCQFSPAGRTPEEIGCSSFSDINEITTFWNTHNCPQVYSDILFTGPTGVLEYNPCNLARIQADTYELLTEYTGPLGYTFTQDTSSISWNQFQEQLISLCSNDTLPGACDLFLTNYCGQRTRAEISADPKLANMCGCYAPPAFPTNKLVPECDPICHLVDTSQKAQPCDGKITRCSNTVCVISDVNINLVNNQVNTAFSQICPACDNSLFPCTCIIEGVDVVNTLNDAGVGAEYLQFCGKNAQCFRGDASGALVQVACPPASAFTTNLPRLPLPITIIIVASIFLVFILLIVWAARRNGD
jgi:hypothetical protein